MAGARLDLEQSLFASLLHTLPNPLCTHAVQQTAQTAPSWACWIIYDGTRIEGRKQSPDKRPWASCVREGGGDLLDEDFVDNTAMKKYHQLPAGWRRSPEQEEEEEEESIRCDCRHP